MGRRDSSTVEVGEIAGPHGVRGEVKLKSYLVGNLHLGKMSDVYLLLPGGKKIKKKLLSARQGPKGPLLTIDGVNDRDEVEKLKGAIVEADSELLPPEDENEYYWIDIIGLKVVSADNEEIGEVTNLMEGAGQDLLIVNHQGREVMVPFVEPIVVEVDVEAGKVTIDPPEGLLDIGGR